MQQYRGAIAIMILASALGACAQSRSVRHPSIIAEPQAATVDAIVDDWYSNALRHPDCKAVLAPSPFVEPAAHQSFASLRSPTILVLSNPIQTDARRHCVIRGEFECDFEEFVRTFAFRSARILYARDSEYAKDFPAQFLVIEDAAWIQSSRVVIDATRTYAVFANFIEYADPSRMEAVILCDLSDADTLSQILAIHG